MKREKNFLQQNIPRMKPVATFSSGSFEAEIILLAARVRSVMVLVNQKNYSWKTSCLK